MQKVPLGLVRPGMILAKPVTNEKGFVLCAEGTELTATLIERLKRMNIAVIVLKGHPVDMGGEEKTREQRIAEVQSRFANVEGDPIMDQIKDAITNAIISEEEEAEEEEVDKDITNE
ncbi:MAG: hypothetical protein J7L53_03660 [Deltaproteobacteria bacterium]|nr:hypothetical protein [Deltaproteobacteria bacterium]